MVERRQQLSDEPKKEKRLGGILDREGNWLVMIESTKRKEGDWIHKCGATILQINQVISIWHPGFVGGGGETKTLAVPFCPSCEKKPPPTGMPVYGEGIW